MELNVFNINLNMDNKNRKDISEFVKELCDYLAKDENQENSMLQKVQNEQKVTVMYRDKMLIERNNILHNYAKENSEKGTMYYIYNKDSEKDIYHLCICEVDKSSIVIEAKKEELPAGVGIDTVLRKENQKYILDTRATFDVRKQMEEMVNVLLKEQDKYLISQRIEGHIYEVGEIENDRVWLYDNTKNDENGVEAFEEINFPLELLNKVTEGSKVIYLNGNYKLNI